MHLTAGVRPFFWNSEPMSPHFCCSPLDTTHHRRTSVCRQADEWEVRKRKQLAYKKKTNGFTFFFTVHCFHSVVIVLTHPLQGLIWLHFLKHGGRFREEYSSSSVSFRRKEIEVCLLLQRGYYSQKECTTLNAEMFQLGNCSQLRSFAVRQQELGNHIRTGTRTMLYLSLLYFITKHLKHRVLQKRRQRVICVLSACVPAPPAAHYTP